MKSLLEFTQQVLEDMGTWCCTSTIRDFKTVAERFEHEGLSFLTITLPTYARDLEKGLEQGFVAHDQFSGFARAGGLPRFLGGFLEQVFDRRSGQLLPYPSIVCIQAIRQLSLMFAKMSLECTSARRKSAIDKYMECEKDVREADANVPPQRWNSFLRIGHLLWGSVFDSVNQLVAEPETRLLPKHGPGATADRLRGNAKWDQQEWTERLERVFPHQEHLGANWRSVPDLADVQILEPGAERPVRVITVPKTLKSPRIIAVEPTCMQYMQQALLGALGEAVSADNTARQLVGWTSQVPNQHLALQGSRNQELATLDLSEASDRVSNQHVRGLLRFHPDLAAGVEASRSRKADVPGYGVKRLAKFASMGSALCFPFEAIVFATLIFVAIEEGLNRQITRRDVESYLGKVRVFGDDIIVPRDDVPAVIEVLEDFGLRVNSSKSFWNGKFRESCGKDYYDGVDVSIVRVRELLPSNRKHVTEIVSTTSLRNRLYQAGYWKSARYLDKLLGRLIPFPAVHFALEKDEWVRTSPVLGRHAFTGYDTQRMCPDLHKPLVRGMVVKTNLPISRLEGNGALLKCLLKLETASAEMPIGDDEHLIRAGRAAVDIKPRWQSSF